jgi:hypothetical protein
MVKEKKTQQSGKQKWEERLRTDGVRKDSMQNILLRVF